MGVRVRVRVRVRVKVGQDSVCSMHFTDYVEKISASGVDYVCVGVCVRVCMYVKYLNMTSSLKYSYFSVCFTHPHSLFFSHSHHISSTHILFLPSHSLHAISLPLHPLTPSAQSYPYISESKSPTLSPLFSSSVATFTATVLLPTPPCLGKFNN
jgi:hypothetical protein